MTYNEQEDIERVAKAVIDLHLLCDSYAPEIAKSALNASQAVQNYKAMEAENQLLQERVNQLNAKHADAVLKDNMDLIMKKAGK